jgi:hypothetical protein
MSVTPQYPTLQDEIARQVLQLRNQIHNLLCAVGQAGRCQGCGAAIFRVPHSSGFIQTYEPDARPHWIACPYGERPGNGRST